MVWVPDLLDTPFYVALAPSPDGYVLAAGMINSQAGDGQLSIVLYNQEASSFSTIFNFVSLLPILLCFSAMGRHLAFSQANVLGVYTFGTGLRVRKLPGSLRWLGFEGHARCWCVADQELLVGSQEDAFEFQVHSSSVLAAAVQDGILAVIKDGPQRHVESLTSAGRTCIPWPLEVQDKPIIRLSKTGAHIFISSEQRLERNRLRVQIMRFNGDMTERQVLFDDCVTVGIGMPIFQWSPWKGASVLAQCEMGECSRLWELSTEENPRPISPESVEVFNFAADAQEERLAMIGSVITDPLGSTERQLYVGQKRLDSWQFERIDDGINDLPVWPAYSERLAYVHADETRSQWCVKVQSQIQCPKQKQAPRNTTRPRVLSREMGGLPVEIVQLRGSRSRSTAGIIYVQGPHRQLLSGLQPNFFHHALFCLLQTLARDGYKVVSVNGPYSVGRGRARREPEDGCYAEQAIAAISLTVDYLREEGAHVFGIVAGSLGAIPALRFLASDSSCCVGALISPAYMPNIPAVAPWQSFFDSPAPTLSLDQLASRIRTPLLIVHGLRDEVAPAAYSSHFIAALCSQTPYRYLSLPEEGHIFRRMSSWRNAVDTSATFIRSYLDQYRDDLAIGKDGLGTAL